MQVLEGRQDPETAFGKWDNRIIVCDGFSDGWLTNGPSLSLLAASTLSHFHTAAVSEEGPKVAKFLDR